MEQKSAAWYEARFAKFTSSELYKLMTDSRTKGQLSDGATTYIFEKIHEFCTNGTCSDYGFQGNKATEWGEFYEPEARAHYEKLTGETVDLCGFVLSEFCDMFGGSPDGLVLTDGMIEIKCPYESKHARYLAFETANDLMKAEPKYYAQIQGNLLATGRQWCDFVSFDPRYSNEFLKMKILRIQRDEEIISDAMNRINGAKEVYKSFMSKIVEMQLQ